MRTRRVGSITSGVILILVGVLCLVHIFYPALRYEYILRGWPLILVLIGVEILLANLIKSDSVVIKYDTAAVVLVFILVVFALCMGFAESLLEYCQWSDLVWRL